MPSRLWTFTAYTVGVKPLILFQLHQVVSLSDKNTHTPMHTHTHTWNEKYVPDTKNESTNFVLANLKGLLCAFFQRQPTILGEQLQKGDARVVRPGSLLVAIR